MKISLVERKKQFFLSLFVASVIGCQVAQASFEFHCPALLNETSRKSVTGNQEYSYSGDTTGDKRLFVKTMGYGIKADDSYKLVRMGGAASEFFCWYQAAEPNAKFNVELHGKYNVDNCKLIQPDNGHITTENTYFKCS